MKITRGHVRRVSTLIGFLAVAAAAGYVVTCAVFPAPLLPRSVSVPSFRGMPADSAVARLIRLGLRGKLADTVTDPLTPAGTVAWQSPVSETALPQGAVVRLGVSSGPPLVSMPDVVDLDLGTARLVIGAAGLRVSSVDTVAQDVEFGTVVATAPASGTAVQPGQMVQVTVSRGAASISVPDLTGMPLAMARQRLAAAGLRVGIIDQRLEGKAGTVLAQQPAAGELVTRESGVNLTISGTIP